MPRKPSAYWVDAPLRTASQPGSNVTIDSQPYTVPSSCPALPPPSSSEWGSGGSDAVAWLIMEALRAFIAGQMNIELDDLSIECEDVPPDDDQAPVPPPAPYGSRRMLQQVMMPRSQRMLCAPNGV